MVPIDKKTKITSMMKKVKSTDRISLYRLVIFNRVLSATYTSISLQNLADEWEDRGEKAISAQTIEKDLRLLRKLGAPVKYDSEMDGWYYTKRDFYFSPGEFIEKLLRLDKRIRCGDYPNQKTIAKEFNTSERKIKRDIEFLMDWAKLPIEYDEHKKGYYYLDKSYREPHIPKDVQYSDDPDALRRFEMNLQRERDKTKQGN
jgi:hypothetical protein